MAIRALTFDVYSALFDTIGGLAGELTPVLRRRGGDSNVLPLAGLAAEAHGVPERALRVLEVSAPELLHVAGSPTDAMGATSAGIRTLWVNRSGDAVLEPRVAPAHESPDLHGVLTILDGG